MELGNLMFGNSRGEYPVERDDWQDVFHEFLEEIGLDGRGYIESKSIDKKYETDRGGFENDVFFVNPYYWGDDESIEEEPNFVYKPTGYELQWYKYPMRDSYANKNLTLEEFMDILEKCKLSMKK